MAADQGGREALNSAWTQGMPDVLCCMCETAAGNDAHALNLLIFKSAQEASYSDCPCQLETRQKPPPHRYSQRKCPKNIILPHCQHTRNAPHYTLPNAMNFLSNVYIFLTLVTPLIFLYMSKVLFLGWAKAKNMSKSSAETGWENMRATSDLYFASQVEADKNHLVIVSLN